MNGARVVGGVLAACGFGLMAVAWALAAGDDFALAAFPGAVAGGLAGFALVVGGMGAVGIATLRSSTARRAREMARVQAEVDALLRVVVQPGPGEVVEDVTLVDVAARTVRRRVTRRPAEAPPPGTAATPSSPEAATSDVPAWSVPPDPGAPSTARAADGPAQPGTSPVDAERGSSAVGDPRDASGTSDAAGAAEPNPWAPPRAADPAAAPADPAAAPADPAAAPADPAAAPADPAGAPAPRSTAAVPLPGLPDLNPQQRAALSERFPTMEDLRAASLEQLRAVPGLSEGQARHLHEALR